jgi:hypothetical protein
MNEFAYECLDCHELFSSYTDLHEHFEKEKHRGWNVLKAGNKHEWMKEYLDQLRKEQYKTYVIGQLGMYDQPTNKADQGKLRIDLVPPAIIEAVAEVRKYGTDKYKDPDNWQTVEPYRYIAALGRHFCDYLRDPQSVDEESGISHLKHMACNIAFLLEMERKAQDEEKL